MPLGMEVGLGLVDFAFDGDPAPPEKWPMSIVANGWMDEDAT